MIKLLKFLLTGEWCNHKYDVYKEIDVFDSERNDKMPDHKLFISRCTKCGDIKKDKIG